MGSEFFSEFNADEGFVQSPEHRPKAVIMEADDRAIPSIDLSESEDEVVRKVGEACRDWGFFQVTNHHVADGARRRMDVAMREFFGAAAEEKAAVRRDGDRVLGYYDGEHTKNVRDWKEVFDFAVEDRILVPDSGENGVTEWRSQWPESHHAQLRESCEEYAKEVQKLCNRVMELIALSLGMESNRFKEFFRDQTSFVRLNHYPPCPIPDLALGVGRHKDAGALTVLAQDHVGGLEVKRKSDGIWIRVKPNPTAYIINVGDIIQVWSNERYESVEHRVVVNSERERFSIPFFLNPSHYTMVEPLPELIDNFNLPKYVPYNWGKFFVTRKGSNFRKLDVENIQIHHFRVSGT